MKNFLESGRRKACRLAARTVACALVCSAPALADESIAQRIERRDTAAIERMLADGMCTSAVDAVKSGLAAKKSYVMLLAGTMYEEGVCVKQDWNRAAGLYMRAEEAGQRFALQKLVAGYARPGRDNGMALWWAAKGSDRGTYPAQCIPAADPVTDPDGFNAALEKMPPATFQGCVYLVGVVNELLAQVRYPQLALRNNVSGAFTMNFVPAAGTVTWTVVDLEVGEAVISAYRNLAIEGLENPRQIKNSLVNYLEGKSKFALTRYPRPEGAFPADYSYKFKYVFTIEGR